MNTNLKKDIEDILEGRATPETIQQCMNQMEEEDLKGLILEKDLKHMLEDYKSRKDFHPQPVPQVSEIEMDRIWQNAVDKSEKSVSFYYRMLEWLKKSVTDFFAPISDMSLKKYSAAMAALLILITVPVIMHHNRHEDLGMKGEDTLSKASMQFAIIDQEGNLLRPNRKLTMEDTIAFRVKAHKEGFCSLYVLYGDQIDMVVADKQLPPGTHDLKTVYSLNGNQDQNTLVMLFSDSPLSMPEKDKKKLVRASIQNNVFSLTIGENIVPITYQHFEVKQS